MVRERLLFLVPPRLLQLMIILVITEFFAEKIEAQSTGGTSDVQCEAESIVACLTPDEVDLPSLLKAELATENPQIVEFLKQADALARAGIGYRTDKRTDPLTRENLHPLPQNLSCTEFVWLVYSLSGLNLGNFHIETKEMAYDRGVYAPYLVKLKPSNEIRPGDTLVYEYSDKELIREEEEKGRYRSGHAVMVVSAEKKIVVGSHGNESTPRGASTGVGYRRLLHDWKRWTAGRSLKAIYRLSQEDDGAI